MIGITNRWHGMIDGIVDRWRRGEAIASIDQRYIDLQSSFDDRGEPESMAAIASPLRRPIARTDCIAPYNDDPFSCNDDIVLYRPGIVVNEEHRHGHTLAGLPHN
jgi:hypothetical protein